jgi:hypothetical protein
LNPAELEQLLLDTAKAALDSAARSRLDSSASTTGQASQEASGMLFSLNE